MNILITGSAGFIGFHISKKLLSQDHTIVGIDNLNDYYEKKIKLDRNKILKSYKNYFFKKTDLNNYKSIENLVIKYKVKKIIHLAAQAGVRYSLKHPGIYFESNLKGFFNILEISRNNNIKHLIFASTSSVYGDSKTFPVAENENTDHPKSFYAATKKSNEVMAYSYSNTYKLPCTGLRFFTVYGPFGRPDMALFKFTKNIIKNNHIELFNSGKHSRDFSYIDDITEGIKLIIDSTPNKKIPYEIYNIGNGETRSLLKYLNEIEKNIGKKAKLKKMPLQIGDIKKTHSNIKKIRDNFGYKPKTDITLGIKNFINWYKSYFR